jgi:hypothetical protein
MNKRPAATLAWAREAATSKRLSRSEKEIWHRARRLGIEFAGQRKRFGSITRLAAALKKGK